MSDSKTKYEELKEDNKLNRTDEIVENVVSQFLNRSSVGIKKYGTTLKENNSDDFLQHLKEELMDAILYIEKLQDERKTMLQ